MADSVIRFLLVDDVRENMVALEALLRRDGLEVHMAHSAAEALEMMLLTDYQLAFVDVQMPEINGYELAELMRGAERTRDIPIIFVTAENASEARRFRGYEAGGVDYIFKPIDPVILTSKAEVFYSLARQAKTLERQRDELRSIARDRDLAIASLHAHANNSPLALVVCDADLVVRHWYDSAARLFGVSEAAALGRPLGATGAFDEATLEMLAGWTAASDDLARHTAHMKSSGPQGEIYCDIFGSVLVDPALGRPSLTLQILDVTERHRAEEVRSLLVGELNHRIKNTLANVQAIMRQTLRSSVDLKEFNRKFSGRLHALARAHSILSDVTWSSASLDQLIDDQIAAGTLNAENLDRLGPPVSLSPENTLRLALVLHELGTNAAKYGALSVPGGRVEISWKPEAADLVLTWCEYGGPPVTPPERQGFGSTLIATGVGDSRATVDWRSEGAIWRIRIDHGFDLQPGAVQSAPAEVQAEPTPGEPLSGCRILVVEDEPLVAMDIRSSLEDAGARVVREARTVTDALAAVAQGDFDLALLDANLIGEPVDRVAAALRDRARPFCFVSGYGRAHLPADFPEVPMLIKPVNPDDIITVVRSLAGRGTA